MRMEDSDLHLPASLFFKRMSPITTTESWPDRRSEPSINIGAKTGKSLDDFCRGAGKKGPVKGGKSSENTPRS